MSQKKHTPEIKMHFDNPKDISHRLVGFNCHKFAPQGYKGNMAHK